MMSLTMYLDKCLLYRSLSRLCTQIGYFTFWLSIACICIAIGFIKKGQSELVELQRIYLLKYIDIDIERGNALVGILISYILR